MKRLPIALMIAIVVASIAASCNTDTTWEDYADWRNANNAWLEAQKQRKNPDGTSYFVAVTPVYDQGSYILMHWHNDRSATAGNLRPYWTSTVDVKYIGRFYNDVAFDSSFTATATYGDSLLRTRLNGVIRGWSIALQSMHVGDSVEVVIPYASAYGSSGYGSINPYSNLRFDMKLVNIPYWEVRN